MKKILILSVSAGQGHVRAAEALVAGTKRWFGDKAKAVHVDLMTLTPPWFRKAYMGTYVKLVNYYPSLWGMLYNRTDQDRAEGFMGQLRRRLESQVSKDLLKVMGDFQPDILLSTHFLPGQVVARWMREGVIAYRPHWIVVTDFLAHRFWLEPNQAGYFAASKECSFIMQRRGLKGERVMVSGIPIMPEFSEPPSREEGAAAFGFDPGRRLLLLMGGGEGVGSLKDVASELAQLPQYFQLGVLAGKNKKLLSELEDLAKAFPGRIFPLGFTKEMPSLMAAADLIITKPGGLTTCECLAMGKPMICISPIPGQEEANSDYLLEHGAAYKSITLPGLLFKTAKLLANPEELKRLGDNAKLQGRPLAAKVILETALEVKP